MPTYTITPIYDGGFSSTGSSIAIANAGTGVVTFSSASSFTIGSSSAAGPSYTLSYYAAIFPFSMIPLNETITSASLSVYFESGSTITYYYVDPDQFYKYQPLNLSSGWLADSIPVTSVKTYSSASLGLGLRVIGSNSIFTASVEAERIARLDSKVDNRFAPIVVGMRNPLSKLATWAITAELTMRTLSSPNSPSLVITTIVEEPALVVSPI